MTARAKGKIERGVDYVQENALRGHRFADLAAQNAHLWEWERTVADTRIHGTTRQQVGKAFVEVERAALRPLPTERFEFFQEGQRSVHRDGHVEVAKAYYSVPPEYLGRQVWVRWDQRVVRVFNQRHEPIALHARQEPGGFATSKAHIVPEKISGVELGAVWLLERAAAVGPQTAAWSQAMLQARGVRGVRALVGLLALTHDHSHDAVEQACRIAGSHQAYRLRAIRKLLAQGGPEQASFEFLAAHPLIRPVAEYGDIVDQALRQSPCDDSEVPLADAQQVPLRGAGLEGNPSGPKGSLPTTLPFPLSSLPATTAAGTGGLAANVAAAPASAETSTERIFDA